jgi:hypothetical protein
VTIPKFLLAGLIAMMLSACGQSVNPPQANSSEYDSQTSTTPLRGSARRAASANTTMYVLNGTVLGSNPPSVTVFGRMGAKYLRTVTSSGGNAFGADASGTLYLSQELNTRSFLLDVYKDKGAKVTHSFAARRTYFGVATDSEDNLYAANNKGLFEYAGTKLVRQLLAFGPTAIDAADDVAATTPGYTLSVFAPGAQKAFWQVKQGVNESTNALTFDSDGNLYAESTQPGQITVYAPKASAPTRTIPVHFPVGMAVDSANNLYVLSIGTGPSYISVFAQGQTTPVKTITDGVIGALPIPGAGSPIQIDMSDNLYVANQTGSVTVYKAGSVHPSRTITEGLTTPRAIALPAARKF